MIYVNVDSPNLCFPYFNFFWGGPDKKTPCTYDGRVNWAQKIQPKSLRLKRATFVHQNNIKHIFETSTSLRLHVLFGIFAAVELSAEKPPTMKQTDKVGQAGVHANNRYW